MRLLMLLALARPHQIQQHASRVAATGDVRDHRRAPVHSRNPTSSSSTSPKVRDNRSRAGSSPLVFATFASWLTLFATVANSRRSSNNSSDPRPPLRRRLHPRQRRLDQQPRHAHPQLPRPLAQLLPLFLSQRDLLIHAPRLGLAPPFTRPTGAPPGRRSQPRPQAQRSDPPPAGPDDRPVKASIASRSPVQTTFLTGRRSFRTTDELERVATRVYLCSPATNKPRAAPRLLPRSWLISDLSPPPHTRPAFVSAARRGTAGSRSQPQ